MRWRLSILSAILLPLLHAAAQEKPPLRVGILHSQQGTMAISETAVASEPGTGSTFTARLPRRSEG
jgi:hypothetical protein